jgi:Protein of unknown function (DUF3106)
MARALRPWFAVLSLVAAASLAQAQAPTDWARLNPQQRSVLAPLERDWSRVTPAQQQKWLEVASRYNTLPPEDKTRVQQRMAEWSQLSPQERARARLNFQEARPLGREERQQQWEAYRALPPEQRRELAERSRPADNTAKRAPRPQADEPAGAVKSNVVRSPVAPPAQPVGPTVVQRGAGATTNLVSKPAAPPLHQQAGLPKVAATPGFVDSDTLLPKRGAQGAAVRAPGAAEPKSPSKPSNPQ